MIAFTNRSKDIIDLFTETCDLLNIHYKLKNPSGKRECYDVFIRTRAAVSKVLENIQEKS